MIKKTDEKKLTTPWIVKQSLIIKSTDALYDALCAEKPTFF